MNIAKFIMFEFYTSMKATIIPQNKNHIIYVCTNISKEAKLPLSVCRGSEKERFKLAGRYSEQLCDEIDSKSGQLLVDDYLKAIDGIFKGHKININVDKNVELDRAGAIQRDLKLSEKKHMLGFLNFETVETDISGYKLHLPLNEDNTIIKDKSTAIHEARHLFDYVTNPKTIDFRMTKMVLREDGAYKKSDKIFDDFMSNEDKCKSFKLFKKNMTDEISQLSSQDVIDVLQTVRQTLKSEKNAYSEEIKYLKRNPIKNFNKIINTFVFTHERMKFGQKLKFANKLLKQEIAKNRNLIKESIEKNT